MEPHGLTGKNFTIIGIQSSYVELYSHSLTFDADSWKWEFRDQTCVKVELWVKKCGKWDFEPLCHPMICTRP